MFPTVNSAVPEINPEGSFRIFPFDDAFVVAHYPASSAFKTSCIINCMHSPERTSYLHDKNDHTNVIANSRPIAEDESEI